jgi:hypothetical protein
MLAMSMPVSAVAPSLPQLEFNGLKLSAPVASMLDTLTLAALRLAADDSAPPDERRS